MSFALGFLCGVAFAAFAGGLAYFLANPGELDEAGVRLSQGECPPCNANCDQGRSCSNRRKEQA